MQSYLHDLKNIQTPDFLKIIDKNWQTQLSASKIRYLTLKQIAQQQGDKVLTNRYLIPYQKEFQIVYFQFQIRNKDYKWRLIKRLNQFLSLEKKLKEKKYEKIPKIPIANQQDLNPQNLNQLLSFLEIFLQNLIMNKDVTIDIVFRSFIQNIVPNQMKKLKIYKHMKLKKKAGGRFGDTKFKKFIQAFSSWSYRFITISSQGIFYTSEPSSDKIQQFITFSADFQVKYAIQGSDKFDVIISSSQRILTINTENISKLIIFIYFLNKAIKQCECLTKNRFNSFAGIKEKCHAQYFIDGKRYFEAMLDAILNAKKQIFMTGWWISPQFCLKRPDQSQQSRLDKVLQKVAKNGIKINIIVYMEPKVALNIDSEYTQECLQKLSDNIKVLRHPAYLLIPFLWSHHQKMVVIDQQIAFMGGLDICYGRMDDSRHLLNDQKQQFWPGVEYNNYRKTDILKPRKFQQSPIDRINQPRMPWHDIAIKLTGGSVTDLSRHFVQYWNYVNFQMELDQRQLLLYAGYTENAQKMSAKKLRNSIFTIDQQQKKAQFSSQIQSNISNPKQSYYILPRQSKISLEELEFYGNHIQSLSSGQKLQKLIKKMNMFTNRNAINISQFVVTKPKQAICQFGCQSHQILRSASMWGIGLQQGMQQCSIHQAYIDLIMNSKNFIYIQNQFFISVQNLISKFIKQRIKRAFIQKENFKIIIVVPFMPGFDGQPQNSPLLRVQLDLMYSTICRGQKSIFFQLRKQIGQQNLQKYIKIFSLRTHSIINTKPVTEIVYVHSKCMIIDDQYVILGSANINDRSMLGSRDSQLCILIRDNQEMQIETTFLKEGQLQKRIVSKFAHNLRTDLFIEHFDLSYNQVKDFLSQKFWETITINADINQLIYSIVFGCYPSNKIRTFTQLKKFKDQSQIEKYQEYKNQIKGFACPFQQNFLQKQDLKIKAGTKEFLVPFINFT